jgi:hypothetical protein
MSTSLTPAYLRSNERIDAFAFLGDIAVLVHALIERELRSEMIGRRHRGAGHLPGGPGVQGAHRRSGTETFEPLCGHELVENDEVLKCYDPSLSKLHYQVLDLLQVPVAPYRPAASTFAIREISPGRPAERKFRTHQKPPNQRRRLPLQ